MRTGKRLLVALAVTTATAVGVAVTMTVANANVTVDPSAIAARVTNAMQAAGVTDGSVPPATGSSPAAGTADDDGAGTARLSFSPSSSTVNVDPDRPAATVSAASGSVGISLQGADPSAAVAAGSNQRVYGDVDQSIDAAVISNSSVGSAQFVAVLEDSSAPTTQRYQLQLPAGVSLQNDDNGAVNLVDATGEIVGVIAVPWAKDANGINLPTSYTVNGNTLIQQTDTSNAVFPVVVDPKITYGWGAYLNAWGYELRSYAAAIVAVGGVSAAIACANLNKLPHPVLRTLATMLCSAGTVNLLKVFKTIAAIVASNAVNGAACYQMKIVPTSGGFTKVNDSNCK